MEEKNKNRENLVVFHLPESKKEDPKGREDEDHKKMVEIMREVLQVKNCKIIKAIRLGKRDSGRFQPRPLLLRMRDMEEKWEVLNQAKKLKTAKEAVYRRVWIVKDQTKTERMLAKKHWMERKERMAKWDGVPETRNGEVIRWKAKGKMENKQINELNEKKSDIDKRIVILTEERDSYACSLEESQDRILMLEKQKFDQEQQIRSQGREIYELQEVNHQLQAQIENLSQRSSYSSTGPPSQTLFNELSSASVDSEKDTASGTTQSMMMMDMAFEDDIECDDECAQVPLANSTMSTEDLHTPQSQLLEELQKEILEVYNQLRKLCTKIRSQPHRSNSSTGVPTDSVFDDDRQQTCNSFDDLRPGQLTSVLQELQQLIHNQLHPSKYKDTSVASGGDQADGEDVGKVTLMAEQIHDLHVELSGVRTHVAGLHADLRLREQQLQQKNTEITQLNSKIEEQQEELQKLRAERDRLQDQSLGSLTRDDVLEQTRHDRNNAIEMKIQCEKELSQAQGEIMSLNNQLMAAIHQKVMVSQQRDQWQTDMEELIDIQMRKRLHQEKIKEQVEEQLKEHKVKRSGSFFSRVKH